MLSFEDFSFKEYDSCTLCPKNCKVNRNKGEKGFCRETSELRLAWAGLHFGEEPPITGAGGSGTIFVTGCNLRCSFCQNYQISQEGMGRAVNLEEFVNLCFILEKEGAENINIVTGSHAIPAIALGLKEAKDRGLKIPVVWNSSAYESEEAISLLSDCVDGWLPDLKTLNPVLAKELFAAEDYPAAAAEAIQWMIQNFPLKMHRVPAPHSYRDGENRLVPVGTVKEKMTQGVIVRHLFLPGRFEETADTLVWLKENADSKACISLMSQYTPVPFAEDEKRLQRRKNALQAIENRLVNHSEDEDLRDLIEAFDFDVLFYQELSDDTSWLPDFSRPQPFSNKLAVPVWHWKFGFSADTAVPQ